MQITVDVTEEKRLTLREFVGDGQCDGIDFDFCLTLPDHSFYIKVGGVEGVAYIVRASDIIQAVVAAHTETQTEKGG